MTQRPSVCRAARLSICPLVLPPLARIDWSGTRFHHSSRSVNTCFRIRICVAPGASKAAFRSLNDALRLELHPFGIHVAVVEPSTINTPAVEKTLGDVEDTIRQLPPGGAARYGAMLREFTRRAYARERRGSPPEVVARAIRAALTDPRPRVRYLAGEHARAMALMPRLLPDGVLDRLRLRVFGLPRRFGAVARAR